MIKPVRRCLQIWLCCAAAWMAASYPAHVQAMEVEVFAGGFASVNSFIFSNGTSLVVLDVQRKAAEAQKLIQIIKDKKLPLTHILISHGHTDHFTGMPLFRREFPNAQIVVASEAIRRDIKSYALYMDQFRTADGTSILDPGLKPKSAENPTGFDYENDIHVLPEKKLTMAGGGVLDLRDDYKPTEAAHMTTVYSKDLNALFLADFGYNKVHLWMGDDITLARVAVWRSDLLRIEKEYAPLNPKIYPGHGAPGDMGLFQQIIQYIDAYDGVIANATSRADAMARMKALYPDYREADFFLKYSVNNHLKR